MGTFFYIIIAVAISACYMRMSHAFRDYPGRKKIIYNIALALLYLFILITIAVIYPRYVYIPKEPADMLGISDIIWLLFLSVIIGAFSIGMRLIMGIIRIWTKRSV